MPPKYYKKKRTYKRKPKKYTKRPKLVMMRAPSGMPTQNIAKLRYDDLINVTSSASVIGSHVFRANSIYDPDYSGAGRAPMGFDQWAALYNHYIVLGSKMTCQIVVPQSETELYWAGVYLSDTITVPYTTGTAFREARKGTSKLCNPSYGKPQFITSKLSTKKFFNLTDVNDNRDTIGAPVTSNPSEVASYILWVQALNAGTVAATIAVTIEYIVAFSEPKDLIQS